MVLGIGGANVEAAGAAFATAAGTILNLILPKNSRVEE